MRKNALALLCVFAAALTAGCSKQGCATGEQGAYQTETKQLIKVVATTGMVADLVRGVGGDAVDVSALMGPGTDPHLYKATARDLRRLRNAEIIFYNGLHLEGKMGELFERIGKRRPVVAVAESLPRGRLINASGYQAAHDPHVWFDVALWSLATHGIERALVARRPALRERFAANAAAHRASLQALDRWVAKELSILDKSRRVLVTAHDAFGYFGRRYGIEVVGLQGVSTASRAGIDDVERVVGLLVKRKVPAIFFESSVPRRTVEAVQQACERRGHRVKVGGELFSDAMGAKGSGAGTYDKMVRRNVRTIVGGLSR